MSDRFADLLKQANVLKRGDEPGLNALIAAMLAAEISEMRCAALMNAAKASTKFAIKQIRDLFDEMRTERDEVKRNTPEAQAAERRAKEAEAESARIVREAERERLRQACSDLALAPSLMNRVADTARRLGVVGERAAISGAYLAMTSRLLKDNAISILRRGAPAGGKNYLIGVLSRLIPKESIISISSASPMALIYHGDDKDALKHKTIVIAEAAAIAPKNNGDENPMTIMLRTLLSEGRIDREMAITQRDGVPTAVHVQRNGPVCLMLTSARENVDPEMLTRLMTSDVDESRDQTLAMVKRTLLGAPSAGRCEGWMVEAAGARL